MPVKHSKDLWKKPPHTEMKHEILRSYLQAWLPILSTWNERLVIIDGFAGPGEYIDPTDSGNRLEGSPLIIIDSVLNHALKDKFKEVIVLLVEKNETFANYLENLLNTKYPGQKSVVYMVVKGEFATTLDEILEDLNRKNKTMAPCFAFIDPFGVAGIPMDLIGKFMKNDKSEIMINFAYDPLNRWLSEPRYEQVIDNLFHCDDWRDVRKEKAPARRKKLLLAKYLIQLQEIGGVVYTLPFEMRDIKNRTTYFLIFGTKHIKGLDLMKKAMWKISPSGAFAFSDYHFKTGEVNLFPEEPNYDDLSKTIYDYFQGQRAKVDEVNDWVVINTYYCSSHLRKALRILEDNGYLKKYDCYWSNKAWHISDEYKRKGAYPDEKMIVFK